MCRLVLPIAVWLAFVGALPTAGRAGVSQEGPDPAIGQERAVRAAFQRYKAAALADEGPAIPSLVTRASVEHYGRLRREATSGDPPALGQQDEGDSLRLVDRMQIRMLRRLVDAKELAAMSPADVVAYAFQSRMLGEEFESSSTLDRIVIEGDVATARHLARGRAVGSPHREGTFRLVNQDGEWRLDLLHTLDLMEAQIGDLAASSDISREEIADNIVQVFTGEALAKGLRHVARHDSPTKSRGDGERAAQGAAAAADGQ